MADQLRQIIIDALREAFNKGQRDARDNVPGWGNPEAAADALLHRLSEAMVPVAWRIVDSVQGTHTEWSSVGEGHRIEVKHAEARGLQVEYAYPAIGADAP